MIRDGLLHILLVEDDEDDFLITRDLLRQSENLSFEIDWAASYEEGFDALHGKSHDLVLIDYQLGAVPGTEFIRQANELGIQLPMILLTGHHDADLEAKAIELGATDYLVKGEITSALLARSIRYALERARSVDILAESERRYRLLFEANPEPMYIHHRETLAILAANEAACDLFGYSQQVFREKTIPDLLAGKEHQRFDKHYEEIDAPDIPHRVGLWVLQTSYHRLIHADVNAHNIDFNDNLARLVMIRDVTETIEVKAEIARKEQAFRQLLEDNRDAVLLLDAAGQVRYANSSAGLLFRCGYDALVNRQFKVPHNDSLFEWSALAGDGSNVIVEVQCSATEWDGETMQLLSLRDISQRKEADKQLHLLQRSIEASYNGIAIADAQAPDMPIIYVNSSFERITGYSSQEVLGKNCRFLQGADSGQSGVEEIRLALQEKREVHTVLRNFNKDGSPFWNELYIAPVRDSNGLVSHYISVQSDISEQKRFESELAYNASHDVLTGLPNRSLLEDRLVQACQLAKRSERKLAVIFIDLDDFKPINNSMGHVAGDQVLIEVAKRLIQQIRPGDTVARLGGDEFVLLLPDIAHEEDVLLVAEQVIEGIALPFHVNRVELRVTVSAGIAISDGIEEKPSELLQRADLAMYKAKQHGRNSYQWYTQELNEKVNERLTLRSDIQKALEREEFEVVYQPQVDKQGKTVIGVEALIRWNHPEKGTISPAAFLPVAENTGQIFSINLWVMETACRYIKRLNDQGLTCPSVAVNISPMQFLRPNFIESVCNVLERTQLDASFLELEVTENALMEDAENAILTMYKLKKLGLRIAIDDFGTGYSSLSYLKRLPVDKIKIDRSFIKEIISDQHDAAITQGIISMAHHLGLPVIAEGVETEPQFAFLRKNHCDAFQGYYFGRPMSSEGLKAYLHQKQASPDEKKVRGTEEDAQTLLLLDDEDNILRALTRLLRREGYRILTASRAQDAFELLAKHNVQVIISDQRMPEMNGTVFFNRVKDLYPDTVRIVLSGYTDLKTVTEAVNQGEIYKFLTKPWDDEELRKEINSAFRHYNLDKLTKQ
ncbi:EAL domain-containing protein [Vreelandella nanhaiensis]|uniref:cyclic-guanylate-specific phosphodiesterase n=1 Tax=Vreelandella nanhaiensis TaxID=1258546 RepID=A0A3S0Y3T6_9GAMM|nr:EAL domain-containing protein [Halomonas nanhaiensis]RUR31720.1 EAL domain-containing protein [Halomonas nanhaiensis]